MPFTSTFENLDAINYRVDETAVKLYGVWDEMYKKSYIHPIQRARYARATAILEIAKKRGIPPELLVDEDYYIEEKHMAPYRLVFRVLETWGSIETFYKHLNENLEFFPGRQSFLYVATGDFVRATSVRLWVLEKLCKYAGMSLCDLFVPYKSKTRNPLFSSFLYTIGGLKDYDVAVLSAFAKLLWQNDVSLDDVKKLLDWRREYVGKQEQSSDGEKRR